MYDHHAAEEFLVAERASLLVAEGNFRAKKFEIPNGRRLGGDSKDLDSSC